MSPLPAPPTCASPNCAVCLLLMNFILFQHLLCCNVSVPSLKRFVVVLFGLFVSFGLIFVWNLFHTVSVSRVCITNAGLILR